jgi:hypothetical protein
LEESPVATLPVAAPPNSSAGESLEQQLRRLEARWKSETGFLSDPTQIRSHPAFQEIVSMGEAVVPIMLRDLEQKTSLWVWALPQITGAQPVPVVDAGNITKMGEAWLRWGKDNGYRWV